MFGWVHWLLSRMTVLVHNTSLARLKRWNCHKLKYVYFLEINTIIIVQTTVGNVCKICSSRIYVHHHHWKNKSKFTCLVRLKCLACKLIFTTKIDQIDSWQMTSPKQIKIAIQWWISLGTWKLWRVGRPGTKSLVWWRYGYFLQHNGSHLAMEMQNNFSHLLIDRIQFQFF